jgi:hypothetical protein
VTPAERRQKAGRRGRRNGKVHSGERAVTEEWAMKRTMWFMSVLVMFLLVFHLVAAAASPQIASSGSQYQVSDSYTAGRDAEDDTEESEVPSDDQSNNGNLWWWLWDWMQNSSWWGNPPDEE